jgi:hypothetical protein
LLPSTRAWLFVMEWRGALGLGERIECLLQLLVGTDGECYVAMVSV